MKRVSEPRFEGPAYRRAVLALDDAVESFGPAGYTEVERMSPLEAHLSSLSGGVPVRLQVARDGKIFGGNYGLELSTAKPVLPATRGLSARGKGMVKMQGVRFRAKRGDAAGAQAGRAARLGRPPW